MVIKRILRHANVSTTATYYIKTAADDVRNAMEKLENNIPNATQTPEIVRDTFGTLNPEATAVTTTASEGLRDWDCKDLAEDRVTS